MFQLRTSCHTVLLTFQILLVLNNELHAICYMQWNGWHAVRLVANIGYERCVKLVDPRESDLGSEPADGGL